jgi:hypothetical protein
VFVFCAFAFTDDFLPNEGMKRKLNDWRRQESGIATAKQFEQNQKRQFALSALNCLADMGGGLS